MKTGIYIGLPENEYHEQRDWLGSTDLKALYEDPVEWQWRRLNEPREDTRALVWGQALHKRALEGHDAAMEWLRAHPEKLRLLLSGPEMTDALTRIGVKDNIPRNLDERAMVLASSARFDDILPDIAKAVEWMHADPTISAVMGDGHQFMGGLPEVSVFARINGVPRKARFDWLAPHAIFDLKSFSLQLTSNPHRAAIKAIANLRYDIQAAAYIEAWHAAKKLLKRGLVHGGTKEQREFLAECFKRRAPLWVWIFVKSQGAPQPLVLTMKSGGEVVRQARAAVHKACENYRTFSETFGIDKEWHPRHAPMEVTHDVLPAWMGYNE